MTFLVKFRFKSNLSSRADSKTVSKILIFCLKSKIKSLVLSSTDKMRPYANRIVGWVMICDDCRKMSQQYFSDQS